MPPKLFAIDPRVIRAQEVLDIFPASSGGRVPSIPMAGPIDPVTAEILALLDAAAPTTVELDWDLLDAILVAQQAGLSADPTAAFNQIVREWLTTNGHLPLPPESLD